MSQTTYAVKIGVSSTAGIMLLGRRGAVTVEACSSPRFLRGWFPRSLRGALVELVRLRPSLWSATPGGSLLDEEALTSFVAARLYEAQDRKHRHTLSLREAYLSDAKEIVAALRSVGALSDPVTPV